MFGTVGLAACLMASGCVRQPIRPQAPDAVDVALAKAAHTVEQAWQSENAIVQAASPRAVPHEVPLSQLPAAAQQRVDMSWQGELAPAVRVLSQQMGYDFKEVGFRPVPPILVSLEGENLPLGDFLQQAGLQAGERADVVIGTRDVTVVYRTRAGADGR